VRDAAANGPVAEVRWFVAGDLPTDLRPRRRGRRRVDSYCVSSLSPMLSVKRRGDRRSLECKVRVGRVDLVQYGTAIGFAEHWVKQQLDDPAPALARGPWLDVHKQIWCVDGVEIARLSVAGVRWWTVAVRTGAEASTAHTRLLTWSEALSTAGTAHSYASWLTDRCRDPRIRSAA
jgi:glutathione S-transferase